LVEIGMRAVVYCGSMGDWPLLTEAERQEGVARLVAAGVRYVGTGAVNSREAVAAPPMRPGRCPGLDGDPARAVPWRFGHRAKGPLLRHPRRRANLPAVIYNSPYYGFATRADLFFELRREHPNLIGFKEFGGGADLRYAAEHITSRTTRDPDGRRRHPSGARLRQLQRHRRHHRHRQRPAARSAATGRAEQARPRAMPGPPPGRELEAALAVLSSFDEGCDLVLYYKHLMVLNGDTEYACTSTKPTC
jgi:4-hydroxy-tetrahydrodipicolinate synthase